MTAHESHTPAAQGISRRTVVKSAVWAAPVIAVAASSPVASASMGNAEVVWGEGGPLASLSLMNGTFLADAAQRSMGPNAFEIRNGPGDIPEPITITIVSQCSSSFFVSGGNRPHGVGVWQIAGTVRASWSETQVGGDAFSRPPWTVTSIFTYPGTFASLLTQSFSVDYRYSQNGLFLSSQPSVAFTLSLTVSRLSQPFATDSAVLTVPLNA